MTGTSAPQGRTRTSLIGLFIAVTALPLILRLWCPPWFTTLWVAAYVVGALTFALVTHVRPQNEWAEFIWSVVVSALLALVPLSTLWFESDDEAKWAATAVVAFHLANVLASRRFVRRGDWRVPFALLISALAIVGSVHASPLLGLAALLAGAMLISNAQAVLAEAEVIRYERAHDPLTGLLNRRGLVDAIGLSENGPLCVVVIDANRFKQINDTYGYNAGDRCLCAIAQALAERLGPGWLLSRHGGDEFVAVATGRTIPADLSSTVVCSISYRSSTLELELELSAGVATSSGRDDADAAMSRAGHALRAAKQAGGGTCHFDNELEQQFTQALRVSAEPDLSRATSIFAVAQPITLSNGDPVGWELLVRWRDEEGEAIPPAEFLPVLAENGLMPQLNDRMLEHGVAFAARFNDLARPPFVSVNITASHLADPELVDYVQELLSHYGVAATRLMIEITESEALGALAPWQDTAYGLAALGVKLAIDDFGSGYSSIERMAQVPVTHLKFDGTFAAATGTPFGEVVAGVVRYAKATGLKVIAEGIEQTDELDRMRTIGVELFQGYRLGRPVSLDDAEKASHAASARLLAAAEPFRTWTPPVEDLSQH